MTAERWQQIEAMLDEVMPLTGEERAARLDQLGREDADLREQVEEMIGYAEQVQNEDFLARPAHLAGQGLRLDGVLIALEQADLEPGTEVDAYHIVERLDGGGMGDVYLAERVDPHMRVALKVVKRGMDTNEILRRFRYEREILARLEHPHIARLHGGGVTDDGRPYFAMEYVEDAKPIDVYCDEHELSIRERLVLFTTVCEAVRYAHRNLVVHRDLKPGNILVREGPGSGPGQARRPQVKLLDFGIAKLLEDDPFLHTVPMTEDGARRMTPGYAAPEQVTGGPTTTATDVYALGIILYRLLTGRRPYQFKDRSVTEIERVILDETPGRPSTVVVRANGTAEHPTPEDLSRRRTATPTMLRRQLAGDLDAITMMALRKEPERRYASAAEFLDDLQRYLDNRPVKAQPDSVAYRAGKFVRRHTAGVVTAALVFLALTAVGAVAWQASVTAREAEQAVERETERADLTLGVIDNMLGRVSPDQGVTFTARDLLEAGLPEIGALETQPRALAHTLNEWGRLSLSVGEVDLADSLHQQALEIQRRELGPTDPDVAESLMRQGRVYQAQGKLDEAERTFNSAIALRPEYAPLYGLLGLLYRTQHRYEEAVVQFNNVIQLTPNDYRAYTNLGAIYYDLGDLSKTLEMWERSVELNPSYRGYSNLATLYYYQGRYAEAASRYEMALEINAQNYQVWGHLASAYYWMPEGRGRAMEVYQRAIAMAEELLAEVNSTDAGVIARLATYYAMSNQYDQARSLIEQAVLLAPEDAEIMFFASYTYEQLKERSIALKWMKKALAYGYSLDDIQNEPGLRELRSDPQFQQILRDHDDAS